MSISKVRDHFGRKKFTIPTLPETALRVQQMVDDPEVGTKEIGALVAEDAPLAAKVLRVANSAYYGLSGRCISTEHASTVLGTRTLRNIVTQVTVMEAFQDMEGIFDLSKTWEHAILTAKMASHLAENAAPTAKLNPQEFYTCGLLHDIGKIVMVQAFGEKYLAFLEEADEGDPNSTSIEEAAFGFHHAEVGGFIAGHWDLPEIVRETVQFHHGPLDVVAKDPAVAVVYAANRLINATQVLDEERAMQVLADPAVKALGLEGSQDIVDFAMALDTGDGWTPAASWGDDPWEDQKKTA